MTSSEPLYAVQEWAETYDGMRWVTRYIYRDLSRAHSMRRSIGLPIGGFLTRTRVIVAREEIVGAYLALGNTIID